MPNIVNESNVSDEKIIFPRLYIKLSLMKLFVKALNADGDCFQHIVYAPFALFYELKISNIKWISYSFLFTWQGICLEDEYQIKVYMAVVYGSSKKPQGSKKTDSFEAVFGKNVSGFHDLRWNMSVKIHFLYSYLHRFSQNLGTVSDEQSVLLHEHLKMMEDHLSDQWERMLDSCWVIKGEYLEEMHQSKSYMGKFFPE